MADNKKTVNSSVASLLQGLGAADLSYGAGRETPSPSPDSRPEPEPEVLVARDDAPAKKTSREKKTVTAPAPRARRKPVADGADEDDSARSIVSLGRDDYDTLTAAAYAFRIVTGKKLSYGKLISLLLNECLPKTHPKVYQRMRLILGRDEE